MPCLTINLLHNTANRATCNALAAPFSTFSTTGVCSDRASYEFCMAQSATSKGGPAIAAVAMAAGPQVSPMIMAGKGCCIALLAQCLLASVNAGRRGGHRTRTRSPECLLLMWLSIVVGHSLSGEEGMGGNWGVYLSSDVFFVGLCSFFSSSPSISTTGPNPRGPQWLLAFSLDHVTLCCLAMAPVSLFCIGSYSSRLTLSSSKG
mmetsp:Transcript_4543/g.10291  ORF Transcript_4543/g.10291 Transcript_4543/m.10291 type:complete len:205 (-) Transcript_4543:1027-1641(-)